MGNSHKFGTSTSSGKRVGSSLCVRRVSNSIAGNRHSLNTACRSRTVQENTGVNSPCGPGSRGGLVEPVIRDRKRIATTVNGHTRARHRRTKVVKYIVVVNYNPAVSDRGSCGRAITLNSGRWQIHTRGADVVIRDRIVVVTIGRQGISAKCNDCAVCRNRRGLCTLQITVGNRIISRTADETDR